MVENGTADINAEYENFEDLLEESLTRSDKFEIGQKVTGKIVSISDDSIFIDISGKSEAILNSAEFTDENGDITISNGETIEAYITSISRGEIQLTRNIGSGYINNEILNLAYKQNIPISGRVTGTTKGGFIVTLSNIRCFCPISQIDIRPVQDSESFINKTFEFKIVQYSERGKNIVLSRRALMEEKKKVKEAELRKTLNVGDIVEGTVESIKQFGLFINIDGFEALVPKSEISWSKNSDIKSFKLGQEVTAKVKAVDWDKSQVTLSIKECLDAPWDSIDKYSEGSEISGKVVNIIKTGAFVELEPGLEGFLHISKLSHVKKVHKPEEIVSIGDTVTVTILNINKNDQKISLELITDGPNPWLDSGDKLKNEIHEATIESVKNNGINARLSNGMLGFIPRSELHASKNADIQQAYTVGTTLKVSVSRMEPENKKLILSESMASRKEERKEFEKYIKDDASSSGSSLGSIFKQQFDKIQKDIK